MRKNSIKNTRINGEVLRELSNIIRGEIKDPRINPMTRRSHLCWISPSSTVCACPR